MINGNVVDGREARVRRRVSADNITLELDAIIDTGFTEYLCLPANVIRLLGVQRINTERVTLADGTAVSVDLFEAQIEWAGSEQATLVHSLGSTPIIGMALMRDHVLTVEVKPGGSVILQAF